MGKILLCDDEDSLCRSLGRILRSGGHEVVAADGPRGASHIREDRFDLILTDIRMPVFDGFEILSTARQYAPQAPVIAMSGSAEIPDAVKAMDAGARDFLIKPFDTRALEEAVARLCSGRTTLIIAHRLANLRHVHVIFVLAHRRVVHHADPYTLSGNRPCHKPLISHIGYHASWSQPYRLAAWVGVW